MHFLVVWFFAAVLMIVGGLCCLRGFRSIAVALASKSWPHTSGEIVQSRLEIRADKETQNYRANVVYRYSIDGVQFESDRIFFGSGRFSVGSGGPKKLLDQYRAGSQVQVFVKPGELDVSTLETGLSVLVARQFGFGVFLIVCALLAFVFGPDLAVNLRPD